jgi:hypothetical protein
MDQHLFQHHDAMGAPNHSRTWEAATAAGADRRGTGAPRGRAMPSTTAIPRMRSTVSRTSDFMVSPASGVALFG